MFLLRCLLLCCLITITTSCICPTLHRQQQFCLADYVIIGRVLSVVDSSSDSPMAERTFTVEVLSRLKGPRYLYFGRKQPIFTPINSACGIDLTPNEYYFLTGKVHHNKLMITQCNWFNDWRMLNDCERTHLVTNYKNNCYCKIKKCIPGRECDYRSNVCLLYPDLPALEKDYCRVSRGGDCHWAGYHCTAVPV